MDRKIFENWFSKHFIPEINAFLKEGITTEITFATTQWSISRRFLYADDTAIIVQRRNFNQVERNLTAALETIGRYYEVNHQQLKLSET